MSLVVVGLSHKTAPMSVLERTALTASQVTELRARLSAERHIDEVAVLATCNRLEVFAAAVGFHGAVTEIADALAAITGMDRHLLDEHLYVHYEEGAVEHAFRLACGLDSMAVGESQVLGQLRDALARAQADEHLGAELNALLQQALRVGKRAHTETPLDKVSHSLVDAAVAQAARRLGAVPDWSVAVVGAGAMSRLAGLTLARLNAREITVVNRSPERGVRLAEAVGGNYRPITDLADALIRADLVICATGAVGYVIPAALAAEVSQARGGRAQVYVDLALPRDVDPDAANLDAVDVWGLGELGAVLAATGETAVTQQVEALVAAEVTEFLAERRRQQAGSTVAALRSRAAGVVQAELAQLESRLPDADEATMQQVRRTVHRIVDKLLHTPTVRVKEMAAHDSGSADYAQVIRALFDLDAAAVERLALARSDAERTASGSDVPTSVAALSALTALTAPTTGSRR